MLFLRLLLRVLFRLVSHLFRSLLFAVSMIVASARRIVRVPMVMSLVRMPVMCMIVFAVFSVLVLMMVVRKHNHPSLFGLVFVLSNRRRDGRSVRVAVRVTVRMTVRVIVASMLASEPAAARVE